MVLFLKARLSLFHHPNLDCSEASGLQIVSEYGIRAKFVPKRPKKSFVSGFITYIKKKLNRPTICINLNFCFYCPKRNPYMD